MKTIPLLAVTLAAVGCASTAMAFGPAVQWQRAGSLAEPRICIPGHRHGECDRPRVIRGDSNESERRIARLFQAERSGVSPARR